MKKMKVYRPQRHNHMINQKLLHVSELTLPGENISEINSNIRSFRFPKRKAKVIQGHVDGDFCLFIRNYVRES